MSVDRPAPRFTREQLLEAAQLEHEADVFFERKDGPPVANMLEFAAELLVELHESERKRIEFGNQMRTRIASLRGPAGRGETVSDRLEPIGTPETSWRNAALRLGEELATSGPNGYYGMTPEEWRTWVLQALRDRPGPSEEPGA